MSLQEKKKQQSSDNTLNSERRSFLKKAKYAAPTLVALGALMKPTDADAGFPKPPSGPPFP